MTLALSAETEARILKLAAERAQSPEDVVENALDNLPNVPSPLLDRLGTAAGRARARQVLQTLYALPNTDEDDGYNIEKALAQNPFTLREVVLPED